jgi:NAD-dependent deacetylase
MGADVERLAALLEPARRVLVFTGAGLSTRSGIPDYRGPDGVWRHRRPVTLQAFLAGDDARRAYWDFKLETWRQLERAEPNAAHRAVVDLERSGRLRLLVTQNVDGLHRKAGTSPGRLVEIHGTDTRVSCLTCGREEDAARCYERFAEDPTPPRCACGGWLKPATISFGQMLVEADLALAFAAAQEADLVLALGSTLSVTPAATIPLAAAARGTPYAIVNMGATDHDDRPEVTLRIDGDVTEVFPAAVRALLG